MVFVIMFSLKTATHSGHYTHSERSEESSFGFHTFTINHEMFRFAQHDKKGGSSGGGNLPESSHVSFSTEAFGKLLVFQQTEQIETNYIIT